MAQREGPWKEGDSCPDGRSDSSLTKRPYGGQRVIRVVTWTHKDFTPTQAPWARRDSTQHNHSPWNLHATEDSLLG